MIIFWLRHLLPALLPLCLAAMLPTAAFSADVLPNSLKAAFIVKMLGYANWPEKNNSTEPMICLAASEEIQTETRRYIKANNLEDKVRVRAAGSGSALKQCWILFIENDEVRGSSFLIAEARENSIMSIGGADDFLRNGGMLHLYLADRKLAFDINKNATDAARIKVDVRLLNLAKRVNR